MQTYQLWHLNFSSFWMSKEFKEVKNDGCGVEVMKETFLQFQPHFSVCIYMKKKKIQIDELKI